MREGLPSSPDADVADVAAIDSIWERVLPRLRAPRVPLATYRVQLSEHVTFSRMAELVEYLERLGVSDVYTSPFLRARPGSQHGYDLVDHNALDPGIGTRE